MDKLEASVKENGFGVSPAWIMPPLRLSARLWMAS
jgi:hypothetical protein